MNSLFENYHSFLDLDAQIMTDTSGIFVIDSARAIALKNIMESDNGLPSTYARNLLIAAGIITYEEPIILPDSGLKSIKTHKYKGTIIPANASSLKIYPNPARDYFIGETHLNDGVHQAMISIYDADGQLMKSVPVHGINDQKVISTRNLSAGVFLVVLDINGKRESVKLNVIR